MMKLKLVAALACGLFAIAIAPASMAAPPAWYVAVDAGSNHGSHGNLKIGHLSTVSGIGGLIPQSQVDPPSPDGPGAVVYWDSDALSGSHRDLHVRGGTSGFIRLGHALSPHWRAELELTSLTSHLAPGYVDSGKVVNGSLDVRSVMFNALYDFAPQWKLHPFVGLGIGSASLRGQIGDNYARDYTVSPAGVSQTTISGHYAEGYAFHARHTASARQWIAGAAWTLSPRLRFDLTYRDMTIAAARQDVAVTTHYSVRTVHCINCANVAPYAVTSHYAGDGTVNLRNQSLTLGLRWSFGGRR